MVPSYTVQVPWLSNTQVAEHASPGVGVGRTVVPANLPVDAGRWSAWVPRSDRCWQARAASVRQPVGVFGLFEQRCSCRIVPFRSRRPYAVPVCRQRRRRHECRALVERLAQVGRRAAGGVRRRLRLLRSIRVDREQRSGAADRIDGRRHRGRRRSGAAGETPTGNRHNRRPPNSTADRKPAVDSNNNIYITSPDGTLSAVDSAGRLAWRFPIGAPGRAGRNAASVAGGGDHRLRDRLRRFVFGVNPNGTQKWQFTPPHPIAGSPAHLIQTFDQGPVNVIDTIVYVVDVQGTAYGLSDLNGMVVQLQRCAGDPTLDCRTDSWPPEQRDLQRRQPLLGRRERRPARRSSCPQADAPCTVTDGIISITGGAVPIDTSPVVSGDLFVVVGTSDGRVCARTLDDMVPGQTLNPPTAGWGHCDVTTSQVCLVNADCPAGETCVRGCIALGDGGPTRSSPIIGEDGTIYVTTDAGLYVIK